MIYISLALLIIIGLFISYYWGDLCQLWNEAQDYEHDVDEDIIITKGNNENC